MSDVMERARLSDLLPLPWRCEPVTVRPLRSTALIAVARRIVRAWFAPRPRVGDVSSAWLQEHELESSKRGQV
jgi:hypothetical protein